MPHLVKIIRMHVQWALCKYFKSLLAKRDYKIDVSMAKSTACVIDYPYYMDMILTRLLSDIKVLKQRQ